MNPWAEPFERIFIWTSWASSDVHLKIPFSQLRWNGFKPSIKRQSKIAKKLSKWEQYEENLFSFKLPSEKFLAIGKNRTACLIKGHPVIFIEGAYDRFLLNGVETDCFFNFDGRMPRSGGVLCRRKRRKQAYGRFLLFKQPNKHFPSIKILFD